ncbi:aldose 1-epimerase [Flagellimonas beolgyonensis]|uniref:aldose epimerase family protein n=1 Tax=Flagellimonas beolgyonensis TaxID=864064 RepID=UPI000F8C3E12|nr:aldose 1-epimerase [Allomuricauda beolgyonensis]
MVQLQKNNTVVSIDKGELVGYEVDGHEFMHQKGSPGWGNADTEMFPIIGPVDEADFRVATPRGKAVQDQHGLLRQMSYVLVSKSEYFAVFTKEYKAGTPIPNSKYPAKSTEETLSWPYDFRFEKSFDLNGDALEITFKISGEKDMPFMLGYHPAFKLTTPLPTIITKKGEITLDQVLAVGSRALHVPECTEITLRDEKEFTIATEGFGDFMCWTEVRNMVCIEPISFYPYAVEQHNLHHGFQMLEGEAIFKVFLRPGT